MGGAHRPTIHVGQRLPEITWAGEQDELTDASPYLCPVFLSAAEQVTGDLKPFHTVALRGRGELALLPGYVVDRPPAANGDPRTYPGWAPGGGTSRAAGPSGGQADGENATAAEAPFPCLLLGSPFGYRTEVAFNFWTPRLFGAMMTDVIRAAPEAGARSIVAPWVPDRTGNADLINALVAEGGHTARWGYEDFVSLRAASWEAHLAALPAETQQRITSDQRSAEASGVDILRLDGEQIRPHLSRIAELTCLDREKNGAGEDPARVAALLGGLLAAGADLRAYVGLASGGMVASCVLLRKQDRLYQKWVGFDHRALGEADGLYFALALEAPVRDAYTEGLRAVELGVGDHEGRKLRGCSSRVLTTALLVAGESKPGP